MKRFKKIKVNLGDFEIWWYGDSNNGELYLRQPPTENFEMPKWWFLLIQCSKAKEWERKRKRYLKEREVKDGGYDN